MAYTDKDEMIKRLYEIKDEIAKLERKLAVRFDKTLMAKIKELEIEFSYLENDVSIYGYDTSVIR